MNINDSRIAVIGLGYVGLPLAVSFAKKFDVVGFDISETRIEQLCAGHDRTLEIEDEELAAATRLSFTGNPDDLKSCDTFIVTTPTPIDEHKRPDLGPVLSATKSIAGCMRPGALVIYESTVYPGATEEECVPLLEQISGLTFNVDFFVGYSPERINPGDRDHRFETILKVTSGSTPDAADRVDSLYATVVTAGTFKAASIKVAEAAKVIENTQRDVNIALINELALVFNKLGIDTQDVLEAAGTKWNFLKFQPGLVGGHCIGVDPYYLTHKAQAVGYHPEIILAGRRLNDRMGEYVATELIKAMVSAEIFGPRSNILILGLSFKENTPDLRNTKVVDIVNALEDFNLTVDVHDPWVDADEAKREYNIALVETPDTDHYDGVVLAVGHAEFRALGAERIRAFGKSTGHVLFDLKALLPKSAADLRL